MENERRRQQKVRYIFFKCLRQILLTIWPYFVSNQDILAKNNIEDNQHRGQDKNMVRHTLRMDKNSKCETALTWLKMKNVYWGGTAGTKPDM